MRSGRALPCPAFQAYPSPLPKYARHATTEALRRALHAMRSSHTRSPFTSMPAVNGHTWTLWLVFIRLCSSAGFKLCPKEIVNMCLILIQWIGFTWKLSEDSLPTMRCTGSTIRNVNYLLFAAPTLETYVHSKYCDHISAANGIQEALIPNPAAEV